MEKCFHLRVARVRGTERKARHDNTKTGMLTLYNHLYSKVVAMILFLSFTPRSKKQSFSSVNVGLTSRFSDGNKNFLCRKIFSIKSCEPNKRIAKVI